MANNVYKYTSDEFVKYLREQDPQYSGSFYTTLSDEAIYELGLKKYSKSAADVQPFSSVSKDPVDVSPGFFGSLPRWGVNENSPEFMKSAYANSLQGMLDLYEDGNLPFEMEEYD